MAPQQPFGTLQVDTTKEPTEAKLNTIDMKDHTFSGESTNSIKSY